MATQKLVNLTKPQFYNVGQLNSWKVRDIANGAIVSATPIDNYTIVELSFDAEGRRIAAQLSDVENEQYLIAAVERRYLGEQLAEFFNDVGEAARIIILDQGVRFESSAFTLSAGITEVARGNVAHFDPASKTYVVSDALNPHADFGDANKKFTVVGDTDDTAGNFMKQTIRLEVQ